MMASLIAAIVATMSAARNDGKTRMNCSDVLMIAIDDLRPQLECAGMGDVVHPHMHTPHICKLAKDSLQLHRSQVGMATCSPSRTALLTGRHPGTTRVWDLYSYFRTVAGNFTTIPQYFKNRGYESIGMGKIFHPGHASGAGQCDECRGSNDGSHSWSEPYFLPRNPVESKEHSWQAVPEQTTSKTPLADMQTAAHAAETLRNISARRHANNNVPFFLAVGFHKPHLPFVFPERFLEYYPPSTVRLPVNAYAPVGMPAIAWQTYGETRSYADIAALHASGAINTTLPDRVVLELRRAYYAAVSYADDNVGVVLSALEDTGLVPTTVVALWGDHGWQLGEHGEWDKHTNFELATHAPLFIRVPSLTDGGIKVYNPTETVDIFPSLVDFALGEHLPTCPEVSTHVMTCTEGTSLRPLITAPHSPVKRAAFSVYSRGVPNGLEPLEAMPPDDVDPRSTAPSPSNCLDLQGIGRGCAMGYSMLTRIERSLVRYTEWVHFPGPRNDWKPVWQTRYAVELYNHTSDPAENVNVFAAIEGSDLAMSLHARLRAGWMGNFVQAVEKR